MDLRQAYERLGVEPGTEPKKARRAYLKLLKVHKPETDPAGFQSIREAWETIQGAKDWEIEALDRAPEPANAAPPDPFRRGKDPDFAHLPWTMPRRSWGQQVILARGRATGEEVHAAMTARVVSQHADWGGGARISAIPGGDGGPYRGGDPLAGFVERMTKATDADRVLIAREAVAAHPANAEAHRLLHRSLLVVSDMPGAAEALRTAHRAGLPGFLEPLLRQHPEHLLPEELDEARREAGHGLDPVAVARALLVRGDAQGAVRAMRWGIDAALRGAKEHVPTVHVVLDFVLQLYRHHEPGPARELHDHLRRWMRDSGRETELRGSQLAATYHLTGELAALPRHYPAAVQAALSRGILDGDPAFAATELAQWTVEHGPEAEKAAEELEVYAPTLFRSVAKYLDRRTAGVYAPLPQPKMKHWGDPAAAGSGSTGSGSTGSGSAGTATPQPAAAKKGGLSKGQMIGLAVLLVLVVLAFVRIVVTQERAVREPLPPRPPTIATTGPTDAQLDASVERICSHTKDRSDPRCQTAVTWAQALHAQASCATLATAKQAFDAALEVAAANPSGGFENILINAAKFDLDHANRLRCSTPHP